MKRPAFIARQSGRPTGVVGRVVAWIMARETAALNETAVELLGLAPADRVLEVGFGHGKTVQQIAAAVPEGRVAGIDVSESMTRLAIRRNRAAVERGVVTLQAGDAAQLPYDDDQFDKALSVHTLYFWRDPVACLRELRRVTRPGGRVVLGFTRKDSPRTASFPADVYTFYDEDEVRALLATAGFGSVETTTVDGYALALAYGNRSDST